MPSDAPQAPPLPEGYREELPPVKVFSRLKLWLGAGAAAALLAAMITIISLGLAQPNITKRVKTETMPPLAVTLLSANTLTPIRALDERDATLKPRQTLIDVVTGLGANRAEAHNALQAAFKAELLDARRLRPGHQIKAYFDETGLLNALSLRETSERSILVTRQDDGGYQAYELKAKLNETYERVAGAITTSLYEDARSSGAGDQQVVDFAGIFAYDIDFQREIHPGDTYEILFEVFRDERGNIIKAGNVVYAELNGKALKRGFYRFTPADDPVTDYYDGKGESATRFLMKTPINGARLSSHFGRRRHPISGYSRLHKGTDFAAPSGTPIYAAGHGRVERASRYGGYGKYVRIRHANGYKTAYAHMSRYGRGIRKGRRVRQGDIIGYVGSTGASTGPHLHYEVLKSGRQVNAMKLNFPTGRKLAGTPDIFEAFLALKRDIDAKRRDLGAEIEVSSLPGESGAH